MASRRKIGVLRWIKQAPSEESMHSGASATTKSSPMEVVPNDAHTPTSNVATSSGVTDFVEDTPNVKLEFGPLEDPTFSQDALDGADLADFLSRPVKITEYPWTQGLLASFYFDPWTMFFSDPAIKRKLDNFAFIQCNLHIKVVMNTSPFYYGCLRMSYDPLPDYWLSGFGTGADQRMLMSQRPGIDLFPSCCEGGEMVLPFMWPEDWLDITDASALAKMGRLRMREFVGLAHANGLSSTSMDVSIYAWATNVKLSGPTYKLSIQSGKPRPIRTSGKKEKKDEYSISGVATAVANFSGSLVPMPIISPFARATQIGANAVASIASMFGFSKVPVLDAPAPMRNMPLGHFATSEVGVPSMKLSMDPKNELTIDPRTVGLPGGDELSICSMVCREAFITQIDITSATAAGEILAQIPITPCISKRDAGTGQDFLSIPPMALVSQHFKYWRGDIKVRIRAVCTKFHTARFRVHWDPVYSPSGTTDMTATSFTKIVDLSPEMDAEFILSYNQAAHWLLTQSAEDGVYPRTYQSGSMSPFGSVDKAWNGLMSINLLNVLSSPGAAAPVSLLIYMSGTPSLEFAYPMMHANDKWSYFEVQSGKECAMGHGNNNPDTDAYAVYHGEVIKSMRMLLHRSVRASPIYFGSDSDITNILFSAHFRQPIYPPFMGCDPNGFHRVENLVSSGHTAYNRESASAYQLLVPCFIGMRGAVQWHFSLSDWDDKSRVFTVGRSNGEPYFTDGSSKPKYSEVDSLGSIEVSLMSQFDWEATSKLHSGFEATHVSVMPTLTLSVPFYSRYRFAATLPSSITGVNLLDSDQRKLDGHTTTKRRGTNEYYPANQSVQRFYEMGPDFTLFFFHSVPTIYLYDGSRDPRPYV
jgi:hypothetical protein